MGRGETGPSVRRTTVEAWHSPHSQDVLSEVKEGFGNQINLCRDRGLNPGPPAQKSDTLPLDRQKSELFRYLEDVGLSGLVAVADDLALTRDSPRQHKITTSFKRFGEQLLTSLRWRTPVRQNEALFDKCVAAILESMLMMREDSYHVEYIMSRSSHSHDQCHWSQGLLLALSGPLVAVWSRALGAVVLATLGGSQLWRWFVTAQLNKRYWNLSRLIALQIETGAQIDKCLRLLKVRASTLGCLATARTPAEQWCRVPMLRLCLRDSLLALSRLLHGLTRSLLEEVPLLPHVDNAQSYVCHCDWSTLVDDKETTDIHLDTLQKIKVLSIMVQSEFLRRLALSLCPALWTPRTSRTLDTVWRVLDSALGAYSQEIDRLTSCYLLYRDYQEPGCTAIRTPSLTWENTELLECIHTAILRIHLMSESSRLVERALEPGPGGLDLETLRGLVVELLVQSRKCSSAWEDSVKRIQTLVRTGGPAPSAQVTEPEEKTDEQRVLVQVGYTDLDPQVEDEVFEEYALHKGEPAFDDDEVIIEEETRKRLRHCAALFSELKSVLCVKAEEMGRREAAALLRRNQERTLKDKDVSCPAEEDDEGSSSFGTTVISPQTAPSDNEDDTDNLIASKLPNWPLPRLKKVTCHKRSKPRHHRKLLCRNSLPNKPKTVSCPNSCPGPAKESPAYPDKNFNTTELEPQELGQGAGGKDERVLHPNLSLFSDLAAEAAEVARCRQHLFLDSEDSLISSPNNTEETFSYDSDD
uniref:Vezatin n=1 Tax=Timema shepardi TaxID=629360 RepID=A0A7R9G1B5_TIMSH|nr:unnamed protein product [Timema shepardi]